MHKNEESKHIQNDPQTAVSCAVVGARGYAGLELIRILLAHPLAKLTECYATRAFSLSEELGDSTIADIPCWTDSEIKNSKAEVIFLATPAEVSLELAPQLIAQGKKVIDLSGAFRLKKHAINEWYPFSNPHTALLQNSTYGLWPFVKPQDFSPQTHLVANPGCYATAAALALVPAVKSGVVDTNSFVLDGKSGATGAGRKASENLLFSEVESDCSPYKIGKHQHYPEIVESVLAATGTTLDFIFTTHLLPLRRGLSVSVYARLKSQISDQEAMTVLEKAFSDLYASDPHINFGATHEKPSLLSLKKVVGTPRAHLTFSVADGKVYIFSMIDNLLKGAASQAVENFNVWMDAPRATGLTQLRGLS